MKHTILTATIVAAALSLPATGANFYPIADIATPNMIEGNPGGNPLVNLIQGPGVGYDAAEPHNRLGSTWYTDAPGGFPSDYINVNPGSEDILVDLGLDVPLSEISLWGYAATNGNGIREFTVDFATDAEGGAAGLGDETYGASIPLNPGFTALNNDVLRQTFAFGQVVVARYVRITAITNYFGIVVGGDRLGLGEVAFEVTTATMGPDIRVTADQALTLAADVPTAFNVAVSNAGDADLVISGTSFTGTNAGAFTVTGVTSPIGALGSGSVAVTFNPAGLGGAIATTLHILSNDADTPEATVMLTGTLPALEPDILVPAQVTLASAGVPETVDVIVSNGGQQSLNLSGAAFTGANAGAFAVVTLPASVAPGGMGTIQISFDPAGLPGGAVDATLQITSNDPDSPVVDVPIIGGVGAEFYPIVSVTSATEGAGADFYPAVNLIQGPGVGYGAGWPHDALGEGQSFAWVTNAPNGGAGDYFNPLPTPSPVMVFDLGQDVALAEVSFWGYANTNANGANLFSLRFATSSDGPAGFGASITYSPTFAPTQPTAPRQSFVFDQTAFARYVEWVPLDNFFGINPPGGDRVGAGEIAFEIVPGAGGGFRIVDIVRNSPTSVSITFTSNVGSTYAVDRSADLSDWNNELTDNVPGEAGTTTFTDDTLAPGTSEAYYRVRRL